MSGTKLRNYCWTYFGESLEVEEDSDIKYCVFQKEKCPDTGKLHFQGYVELTKPMRIGAVQELLGIKGAHLEKRRGNRDQARDYCMKEESRVEGPWEIGEFGKGQGSRSDLKEIKKAVLDVKYTIDDVIRSDLVVSFQGMRFAEGLQKYRKGYEGPRNCRWYWGETEAGKTRRAVEEAEGNYDEVSYANGFFIGYRGNKNVIFNDIRGEIPLSLLLKLTDRYKLTINIKGGEMNWDAENIWFTSSKSPVACYFNCRENIKQLERRLSKVEMMRRDGTRDEVGGNTKTPTSKVENLEQLKIFLCDNN